jgi:hypothetical protein
VKHLKEHDIDAPAEEIRNVLDPQKVMLTYNSEGGTGKSQDLYSLSFADSILRAGKKAVQEHMKRLAATLEEKKKVLKADQKRVTEARDKCRAISAAAASVKDAAALKSLVHKHL